MVTWIGIDEGEDTDQVMQFKRRVEGSTNTAPYLLNGVTEIEVIVKAKKVDTDAQAKFNYKLSAAKVAVNADGTAVNATYSEIVVHVTGADQTPPGNYYFTVKATKAGKKETIGRGVWHIENT